MTATIEKGTFTPYTPEQKRAWANNKATKHAEELSQLLGFTVSPRIPFVLLQAAHDVAISAKGKRLPIRICLRSDHYANAAKVLACAILHYDLASNIVATRDQRGVLTRCDNGLFANLLNMPARTVDNAIYSLKRSGLYLSFEQREKELDDNNQIIGFKGLASIKRINSVLFEMLGLSKFASVQRMKAKQRAQLKKVSKTPAELQLEAYRKTDDKVREKRDQQRAAAAERRQAMLGAAQKQNRTAEVLRLMALGHSQQDAIAMVKQQDVLERDELDDIPY
ncbi:hypothetical protein [Photobacterium leiognathi]|uniref:hypothetical protein n=1 Tax=Photobacterium leiognathi TaxID=553611 RepID=UPI0027386B10|nr:hypothetical protein [Photobacterium leiognathi]